MVKPRRGDVASTFIIRCWREWSTAEPRWRGRIEHVQSGDNAAFLDLEEMLDFVRRFAFTAGGPLEGR
jgi:hypothetical protein